MKNMLFTLLSFLAVAQLLWLAARAMEFNRKYEQCAYRVKERYQKIQLARGERISGYIEILDWRNLQPDEYRQLKEALRHFDSVSMCLVFEFIIRPGYVMHQVWNHINRVNQKNHS